MKQVLFFLLFFILSIKLTNAERLRSGDLIFQREGDGEFSKAISDATSLNEEIKFVHVGIIEIDSIGNANVIEASPESGVRIISLDDFINYDSNACDFPAFAIKRITIEFPAEKVIENAKSHIGEPYDWQYLPDNGKMYCSELVYESYIDKNGDKIFYPKPMNFKDSNGRTPKFWIKLFEQQNMAVPQDVPGSNPNDLSKNPLLRDVNYKFKQK